MKRLLFFALLFTIGFIGCKKGESSDPNDPNGIVGKWNIDKTELISLNNGVKDDEDIATFFPGSYIEFKSDGSLYMYGRRIDEAEFDETYGTYTISNNTVRMVTNGNALSFEIQKLEKKVLILSTSGKYTEGNDEYLDTISIYLSR